MHQQPSTLDVQKLKLKCFTTREILWDWVSRSSLDLKLNSTFFEFFLTDHRCTVILFVSFEGGTWGSEKIWEGVIYFHVLLHFYDPIFKVFWLGTWGAPPPPPCDSVLPTVLSSTIEVRSFVLSKEDGFLSRLGLQYQYRPSFTYLLFSPFGLKNLQKTDLCGAEQIHICWTDSTF